MRNVPVRLLVYLLAIIGLVTMATAPRICRSIVGQILSDAHEGSAAKGAYIHRK